MIVKTKCRTLLHKKEYEDRFLKLYQDVLSIHHITEKQYSIFDALQKTLAFLYQDTLRHDQQVNGPQALLLEVNPLELLVLEVCDDEDNKPKTDFNSYHIIRSIGDNQNQNQNQIYNNIIRNRLCNACLSAVCFNSLFEYEHQNATYKKSNYSAIIALKKSYAGAAASKLTSLFYALRTFGNNSTVGITENTIQQLIKERLNHHIHNSRLI